MQDRYSEARAGLAQRATAAIAAAGLNTRYEADLVAKLFDVASKRRSASAYKDVAEHLLDNYAPEVAYFVAVELNEGFEKRIGYPPIGQIFVAWDESEDERAAQAIACSLWNFPRVDTARLAFGVIKSEATRSLVKSILAAEDADLAEYICDRPVASPGDAGPKAEGKNSEGGKVDEGHHQLSDGIKRMPRLLTAAEARADRLFLHLQIISRVELLVVPVIGLLLKGRVGLAVGVVVAWGVHVWMRRSMGLRGKDINEGWFIRMRERANGSRCGLLEILIEHVRQRPFTREQCIAITQVFNEGKRRLVELASSEERIALVKELDRRVKEISYGHDA
jgi:hypothetical protein